MRNSKSMLRSLLPAVVPALIMGCEMPSEAASVVGEYNLVTFDGAPLPYRASTSGDSTSYIDVHSMVLSLAPSREFSLTSVLERVAPSDMVMTTNTLRGWYDVYRDRVVLTSDEAEPITLKREEHALVMSIDGHLMHFSPR